MCHDSGHTDYEIVVRKHNLCFEQLTGGKRAYGPGSFGPSVPVAEPGSITRDQCRSRFQYEPGPIGLHVDARRREGGLGHWSRFVERTRIVDPGFFFHLWFRVLFGVFCIQFNGIIYIQQ
jgi:hypothetical protein